MELSNSSLFVSKANIFNSEKEDKPDLSFIDPITRRKLSPLDKAAMFVMQKTLEQSKSKNIKLIFASQYGELDRLYKLIAQHTNENEVSPSAFSGSVHNAAIGFFSIFNKITTPYNSISAGNYTFSNGLLEALMSTNEYDEVLFCYADSNEKTVGISFLITTKEEQEFTKIKIEKPENTEKFQKTVITNDVEKFIEFTQNDEQIFKAQNKIYQIRRIYD